MTEIIKKCDSRTGLSTMFKNPIVMNRFNARRRIAGKAFTLIELLVVIAIIAVLAALLLPVLSRAKNQSAKATDLNNLHQVLIALHIYTADNKDVLTPPNWDYGAALSDGKAHAGWLYTPDLSVAGAKVFNG